MESENGIVISISKGIMIGITAQKIRRNFQEIPEISNGVVEAVSIDVSVEMFKETVDRKPVVVAEGIPKGKLERFQ